MVISGNLHVICKALSVTDHDEARNKIDGIWEGYALRIVFVYIFVQMPKILKRDLKCVGYVYIRLHTS